MSEYIADSAALTYTADRIRAKTGGTEPITWDATKGFGDAVDAIQTPSGETLNIVMTATVSNAKEMLNIIRKAAGSMTHYVAYVSSYVGGGPIENQIIDICTNGTAHAGTHAGIRYRGGGYSMLGGFGDAYDAAVTIGDVYTIRELV